MPIKLLIADDERLFRQSLKILLETGTDIEVGAQPGHECLWQGEVPDPDRGGRLELPPLFEIYLRYAGRVVGPPVIDREFKTIDFFVLFDVDAPSERARRIFFG